MLPDSWWDEEEVKKRKEQYRLIDIEMEERRVAIKRRRQDAARKAQQTRRRKEAERKGLKSVEDLSLLTPEEKARRNKLKYIEAKYKITAEQYESLQIAQDNKCAICSQPERLLLKTGVPRSLAVDHDHANGTVRGLLCGKHNWLLGLADDDPTILDRCAAYLRKYGK